MRNGQDNSHVTDDARGTNSSRHARILKVDGPIKLALGGELPSVSIAYETYGRLNEAKDNAVFIAHALSGDSHVARHDGDDAPGWWDAMVGPGKPIDTDQYFVICSNCLGGCRGTTGPGDVNPRSDKPYGREFPTITIADMVDINQCLVDHLAIDRLLAVVGGSMGGMLAMRWAQRYPDRVRAAVPIATSAHVPSQALAFDVVGRNAILHDPGFRDGQYYDEGPGPDVGLALARMLAHITYLSPQSMDAKFEADRYQPRDVPVEFEKRFSVGAYLGYQGARFVDRFDANSYIRITTAIDLFDLGSTVEEVAGKLGHFEGRWLVISFSSDWLFSPAESQRLVEALLSRNRSVTYAQIESSFGHDAFLIDSEIERYGTLVSHFLASLQGRVCTAQDDTPAPGSTGAFTGHRLDYERIVELIEPEASVLDLGCGEGQLLSRLHRRGHTTLCGVEIDEEAIVACAARGLNVIYADLETDLGMFADRQFDCVVLSRTVQTIQDVPRVIDEVLRIGRRAIVTFPNFGYDKLRTMLSSEGRAPQMAGILKYEWYNSPNLRFFTIRDFEEFCTDRGIVIERQIAMDTEGGTEIGDAGDPNREADLAIVVLSR
jgi:homoserine O-acetyltransferase